VTESVFLIVHKWMTDGALVAAPGPYVNRLSFHPFRKRFRFAAEEA